MSTPNPLWNTSFKATSFGVLLIAAVCVLAISWVLVALAHARFRRVYGTIVQQIARYIFVYRNDGTTLKLWVRALHVLIQHSLIASGVHTGLFAWVRPRLTRQLFAFTERFQGFWSLRASSPTVPTLGGT